MYKINQKIDTKISKANLGPSLSRCKAGKNKTTPLLSNLEECPTQSAGYGIGWNHNRAKTLAFSACHWLLVYLDYRLESGGSIKVCLTGCPRKWRCVWLGLQREWPTGSGKQHQPTDPVSGDYSSRSCHKENRLWIRSHHGRATELTIFQSEFILTYRPFWILFGPHVTPVVKLISAE